MGTGWLAASRARSAASRARSRRTSDGGKTWKVARVTAARRLGSVDGTTAWARYDDGENLAHGRRAHLASGRRPEPADDAVLARRLGEHRGDDTRRAGWALCVGQPGAGNVSKSVYRLAGSGWKRIAYTEIGRKPARGGVASYGYPVGMAMADDGFGLIWESRGTMTSPATAATTGQRSTHVARPEVDFGVSGSVLKGGVGYVVLSQGGRMVRRLLSTHDAGRHWRTVHRWR